MPIVVPKSKRVSAESSLGGTTSETCAYGYDLLHRGSYASVQAPTGAWDILWFQAPDGALKQARWYGNWTVTEVVPAGKALLNTPLASIMWGPQNTFRLYYLSPDFELREWCWDSNDSKYDGALNNKKVKVNPHSKLSALVFNGPNLRVYYQGPNGKIEEYTYGPSNGWNKGATLPGDALLGTSLAYVNRHPVTENTPSIRGYYQEAKGGLAEHVWEDRQGWNIGDFKTADAPFLTPIAATVSPENNFPKIHVFWLSVDDTILQSNNHRGWSQPNEIDSVSVVHGSKLSATSFTRDDGSVDVRVFGTNVLNVIAQRIFRSGKWESDYAFVQVGEQANIKVVGA